MPADAPGSKSDISVPELATSAVLVRSTAVPAGTKLAKGYDFECGVDYSALLDSYLTTGFQASHFGHAVEIVNHMRAWRLSDEPITDLDVEEDRDPEYRKSVKCKIFLGYTSNLVSSGIRETIKYLVKNRHVDVLVSTAGGVEEDFIKCLAPTYIGDFTMKGEDLRKNGLNRIGNLIVPNDNYCKFEDWIIPIFDQMLKEQQEQGIIWTPSKLIHRLGKEINHPDSIYYWAYKNNIPVYSPAITDGSLGDMLYFHSYKSPGLVIDLVQDIRAINTEAVYAKKTGMIILGGGIVKHHSCNANLMRNGADFAVFINTAQEFDGSDAGARPDEAVSWGKIKVSAESVKIYADASLILPLLVAQTFAKND
ncbi:Deoxyhypusine synthase [Coemansia spiralis]|uniref:deoxyhypusine synthase n=2 Tax=Coemansia TaxID=4863 RepID=A0A9W8KZ37_9FUNG|nr:DHS-like NAD/FAD-binding domain-containing protein [Coemansia spiralis]KAJ1991327.1 Deoxyhypusine synthase [Coemansia umbellata]KAJ2622177.1 Deoxyhypusine synthase [Coemansia sp. RSA 1358]KAJ2678387.1 Deoxyhypusine synthase [Coemansia spiralis]